MASSKVMRSRSPPNQDLPRQSVPSSLNHLNSDQTPSLGSINMEEMLRDMGGYTAANELKNGSTGNRTMDETWRDIVSGGEQTMNLEDYLTKEGVVIEEDVRVPAMAPHAAAGVPVQYSSAVVNMQNGGYGNTMVPVNCGSGRGKRRSGVEDVPLDKATQQKQRRMIKNRESAARSRERKQAYTVELEALVTKLEEENARLLKEEAEMHRERFKQLMETLIPIEDKPKASRVLRRTHTM